MHAIYGIENIINGKLYIGSAVDYKNRRRQHQYTLGKNTHKNKKLQNSWNKYGDKNFIFHVIEPVGDTENLIKREQYWIDFYRTLLGDKFLYNMNPLATSNIGVKMSELSKKRMSVAKIGSKLGPRPDYVKKKISQANMGKRHPPHIIDIIAGKNRGKLHTAEHKNKISLSLKNRIFTEEEKNSHKIRTSMIRRKFSNEQIKEIVNLRSQKKTFNEIGAILGCSPSTIGRVFSKTTIAYGVIADPLPKDALKFYPDCIGRGPSIQTIEKIAQSNRGKKRGPRPEWVKAKISNAKKGVKMPPESVKNMIAAITGRKLSDMHKKNISEGVRKRKATSQK